MGKEALERAQYWLNPQHDGAIAFMVLATCIVSLKLFANYLQRPYWSALGFDVICIIAALLAFLALCVCAVVDADAYLAYYSTSNKTAKGEQYVFIYKASYALSVVYPIACVLPKLSVFILYVRLFSIDRSVRRATFGTMAFLVANAFPWLIPSIVVCRPISQYWSLERHKGRCIDYNKFGTWISLPHIISDIVILMIPMPVLWHAQMKVAKKVGLFVTFLAGSLGIVGACIRLALYVHRTYVERPGTAQTTGSIAANVIVSYAEPGMYLIAACLPSLRILLQRLGTALSTALSSLLQRQQSYTEYANASPNHDMTDRNDALNVKLTGIGRLDTLAHEVKTIKT